MVLAIMKGLREQFQVGGEMEVGSIGPHFTGHDDEPIDEEDFTRFHDDVTSEIAPWTLGPSSAPRRNRVLEHVSGGQESPRGERKGQGRCHGSVV